MESAVFLNRDSEASESIVLLLRGPWLRGRQSIGLQPETWVEASLGEVRMAGRRSAAASLSVCLSVFIVCRDVE